MEWLKDKKNQTIVALIAAVVIVAVALVFLWPMIFGSGDSSTETGADMAVTPDASMGVTPDPNAAAVQPASGTPAAAGAQPAAKAATAQVASAGPTEAWRPDPFLPFNYKRPGKINTVKPVPPIWDLPIPAPIFSYPSAGDDEPEQVYEIPQPARRMAGLMLNGKVYAIIETNGSSEIVQPGDMLKDQRAMVEKIERDKVILKTTDEKPRYLVVSMAANRQNSYSGDSGGPMPGGPMPGGPMPGGPMPRPGGPPGMPSP